MKKSNQEYTTILFLVLLLICRFGAIGQSNPLGEKARFLNPLPGKALVYLFQNGPYGQINVKINSQDAATLSKKQFYFGSFEPGEYSFSASANNENILKLNLEPDKKYYISVGSKASGDQVASMILFGTDNGSPNVKMELFDSSKGDKSIKKCNLFWMNVNAEAKLMLDTK